MFCFAAASPPLVGLLSAFSSLHGMLHSSPLGIFHLSFPNYFTASPQGLAFPWVIWGTLGWASVPTSTPGSCSDLFLVVISQVFSLLVSEHSESQPRRAQLLMCSLVEGGGLMLAQITWELLFPPVCLPTLSAYRFNSCLCVSLPFFILFFPFPLLRYLKYSQ